VIITAQLTIGAVLDHFGWIGVEPGTELGLTALELVGGLGGGTVAGKRRRQLVPSHSQVSLKDPGPDGAFPPNRTVFWRAASYASPGSCRGGGL
jgi:hypothetical protein